MYLLFGLFLLLCILFLLLNFWKRRRIICKICAMDSCVPCGRLAEGIWILFTLR